MVSISWWAAFQQELDSLWTLIGGPKTLESSSGYIKIPKIQHFMKFRF